MRVEDRYQFAREQQPRYWAAGKAERSRILDAFCLATGYGRKYAITMLRGRKRVSVPGAAPVVTASTFKRAFGLLGRRRATSARNVSNHSSVSWCRCSRSTVSSPPTTPPVRSCSRPA
jgi:hypothetical protein